MEKAIIKPGLSKFKLRFIHTKLKLLVLITSFFRHASNVLCNYLDRMEKDFLITKETPQESIKTEVIEHLTERRN